jgi:hypothetical protein
MATYENYKPQSDREESYMAVETGVGSGKLYRDADLFASEEAARVECAARNIHEAVTA